MWFYVNFWHISLILSEEVKLSSSSEAKTKMLTEKSIQKLKYRHFLQHFVSISVVYPLPPPPPSPHVPLDQIFKIEITKNIASHSEQSRPFVERNLFRIGFIFQKDRSSLASDFHELT